MKLVKLLTATACVAMLGACGGGESVGTPASVSVVPAPADTPTPTPTPVPTPTPTPTGSSTSQATIDQPVTPNSARYPAAPATKATTGIALPIGKCLNYAGQLDYAPDLPSWARGVVDTDFAEMRAKGFRTLRVPVNFEGHSATTAPYTIDPSFMARVKHVVDTATAAGLHVIVDNHIATDLYADLDGQTPRFRAIWQQVAATFKDEPGTVYFELLNEPMPPLYNTNLKAFYTPTITDIRKTNPTRPIIVSAEWTSDPATLATFDIPDDPYIVPTVHYYHPMAFSHQGASWITPVLPMGVTWGSDADYAELDKYVAMVKTYMARTGRVPFVGEFGAVETIPSDQRANYHDAVSHAFAAAGVQSCVWGYVNSFSLRSTNGTWAPLVDLLGTTSTL